MKRTPLRRKSQLKRAPIRKKAFETTSSKRTKATPMKRCDDLFRAIVRSRGRCEGRCGGTTENLQCAHIQPRSYRATRHDEDNALCLCLRCHVYFTHRPLEWIAFVGEERWWALYRRALPTGAKIDWKAREAALRERAKQLGVA